MSDAWVGVVGSVIVAVLTLIGVLTSNSRAQAVTDTKLEELTRQKEEVKVLLSAKEDRWLELNELAEEIAAQT